MNRVQRAALRKAQYDNAMIRAAHLRRRRNDPTVAEQISDIDREVDGLFRAYDILQGDFEMFDAVVQNYADSQPHPIEYYIELREEIGENMDFTSNQIEINLNKREALEALL